jgi:signal transduction histidine kinase
MSERANVLLVDDQPARLLSYEAILAGLDQNLVRAQSGTEALRHLMEMEFAAILLDVNMPELDGFETAALIREHPRFEQTPIIFVTGVHVTDFDRLRGYRMGAVDYVYIPVVPEILRGKVQVLVQLYLQRRELMQLNRNLADANAELERAHARLKQENTRELHKLNGVLEHRNAELARANAQLTAEVAERKHAEGLLQEAARRKDEFLAILGHELRNPLSAMHNCVQLMQVSRVSEQQLGWARDLLERQLKHLTRLMDDLLDVSRVAGGHIRLQCEPVELARVITQAVEMNRPLINAHRHRLAVEMCDEPLYVNGDLVRLTQVVDNLLGNAVKFMDDGGAITLGVGRDEDDAGLVVIRIRDRGAGIAPHMLERVFELFTQGDASGKRNQSGLGIGLALVRGLVELHGGRVNATSDGPGRGSEFTVRLPRFEAEAQSRPPDARYLRAPVGARLLIIDDNEDAARSLAMCLEGSGYQVHVACDGTRGIALALENRPDAVLLDIGLPDIDGYEVARHLRRQEGFAATPLIAMTGFGGHSDRGRAEHAGIDRYLVKPVDFGKLMEVLAEHIRPAAERVRRPRASPAPAG